MKKLLFLIFFSIVAFSIKAQVLDISEEDYVYKIYPNMDKPVVIDFYATWCGPCRQYSPIFNSIASEFYGEADFYRVNIDENGTWAQEWEIEYIPTTVIIYTKGEKIYKESGAIAKEKLRRQVKKAIAKYKSDRGNYF